jgi:hypothetical protein
MTLYDEYRHSEFRFLNYEHYGEVLDDLNAKTIGELDSVFDKYAQLQDENERLINFLKTKEIHDEP